ncbi:DNA repair protein RecO [Dysgonomonas sp. 216]|uniref:DNA repair protein RecO n=1 Tax=Dysgonomonas sp. 216 TaxID=2302934 RepID=UPI0013D76F4E|nr:DNA repair protein RecO [Dysgonomonas sp. 216]
MQQKVQGIVLNTINYNDKYILTQIFTNNLGRVTYMVPKATTKTSKVPRSLFMPLALLDLQVEHRDTRDIQRIKEAHSLLPLFSIPSDMAKSSMVFFLSEFLTRVLRDVNDNNNLFQYLIQSVQLLELADKNIANYHLVFILNLTRFLGFYPNLEDYKSYDMFDMLNGVFVDRQPLHKHYINAADSFALSKLARISYENMHLFKFSRNDRINIINRIIEYYRIHLGDFPSIKSLDVLHELF